MDFIVEHIHIIMFAVTCLALLSGYPVALTLGGTALVFAGIGIALGIFEPAFLRALPSRILGTMENQVLMAVPLFVLMGVILERSKLAEDLLDIAGRLLGHVRGGLGFAVILVGAMLAASTGIVGATVITMTLIALPSMLKQGYSPRLASGTIAAAGTLGQIIPPSIVLILLADVISNANQMARMEAGLPPSALSVGDLFAGALIPGFMLVAFYLIWIALNAIFNPKACPKGDYSAAGQEGELPLWRLVFGLAAPLVLIVSVLGSILAGIASPTEAAAVGAVGALFLAGARLRMEDARHGLTLLLVVVGALCLIGVIGLTSMVDLRLGRDVIPFTDQIGIGLALALCAGVFVGAIAACVSLLRSGQLEIVTRSTAEITAMVFLILIGAALFSIVFRGFGGDEWVSHMFDRIPGGMWGALALTMVVMFILGFFLDFIEITFVVVPLVAPPLILMGADPVWLAILMALNLQTSFLTPPFGFALFYLRGSAPPEVKTLDIWRGALPFIGLQVLALALVIAIPALATWLPSLSAR
jgi:tripartite ATP-independent transporter DctM subunit